MLSNENHIWFNKQNTANQDRMNRRFQEYKECKVVFVEHVDTDFKIRMQEFSIRPDKGLMKIRYDRAKEKRAFERKVKDELGDERDGR